MASGANAFLQGVLGGGQFIDQTYSRRDERDWLGEQRQHQTAEWQREKDLRVATKDYYEQADRMKELQTLYTHAKTLPKDKQQQVFDYATSTIFNELEPDLVNMGANPGEHKEMLPPKMVKGGMIPQVAVIDDKTGKTLRTDNLTKDRKTGGTPMMADGGAIPEYYIASANGRKALRKLRARMIELGGKPPDPKDRFGKMYTDTTGNTFQDNTTTGESKLLVSAKNSLKGGSGSGSGGSGGGSKNLQFFYTSEPFALQTGTKDGEAVTTDAISQAWYDPNTQRFYEGTLVNGRLRGQAHDVTQEMQAKGGVSAGLATDLGGGDAPAPAPASAPTPTQPQPGGVTVAAPAAPSEPFFTPSTKADRAQSFQQAGAHVAQLFQQPTVSAATIKKAKQLAKDGKWDEVEKLLPPDNVAQLRKALQK